MYNITLYHPSSDNFYGSNAKRRAKFTIDIMLEERNSCKFPLLLLLRILLSCLASAVGEKAGKEVATCSSLGSDADVVGGGINRPNNREAAFDVKDNEREQGEDEKDYDIRPWMVGWDLDVNKRPLFVRSVNAFGHVCGVGRSAYDMLVVPLCSRPFSPLPLFCGND